MKLKVDSYVFAGMLAGLYFIVAFGLPGLSVFLLMMLFIIPIYMMLSHLPEMVAPDRLVLSIFLSLGIIPTLVYYVGFILGSLRFSLLVVTALLIGTHFILQRRNKD